MLRGLRWIPTDRWFWRRGRRGLPRPDDFRLETGPIPEPLEGQILVATKFLSRDPYMRGRMDDAESYAPPVSVGGVMEGEVVAEVVRCAASML